MSANLQMNFITPEPKKFTFSAKLMTSGLGVFAFAGVFLVQQNSSNQFSVQIDNSNQLALISLSPTPIPWSILSKLDEKDGELASLTLKVSDKKSKWSEQRISRNPASLLPTIRPVTMSGPDMDIGLKLLNTITGDVSVISISRQAGKLIAPAGYDISIISRPSGIYWNYWNTQFKVNQPANLIVIKNNFPELKITSVKRQAKNSRGKSYTVIDRIPTVESRFYVPYSPDLHQAEIIKAGSDHIKEVVKSARNLLAARNVYSRAFPGIKISELNFLPNSFFEHIPLLEQSDLTEFILEPQKTAERVLVLLGTNKFNAFRFTCNSSSACGWIQFTPPTYRSIVKTYASAKLEPDFNLGATDHINVMAAAILLYDYNLADLVKRYGESIAQDPRLEEYLAAAYNGSPRWVHQSLDQTLNKNRGDAWTTKLREETLGFMAKLRYLNSHGLP